MSLGLSACTSTGGPSGGILGLVTGGVLGHLIDNQVNSDNEANGYNNGTGTGTGTGTNGTGTTGGTNGSSSGGLNSLLLGTTKTNSTDPTTGTTTEALQNQYAVINPNSGNTRTEDFFGDNKGAIVGAAAGALSGMVTDQFRKGEIQRKYDEGYAKAKSDSIKEFYWLKRDAQKAKGDGDNPPVQYRYYEVEVPAHTTSDGVFIDKHKRIIEVVE